MLALIFVFSPHRSYAWQNPDSLFSMDKIRIVVIGSSTAFGTGAHPPDSAWVNRYRAYLQTLQPGNEVINLALGGYQTYHLMPSRFKAPAGRPAPDTLRNITRALSLKPDGIILNLPSNDASAGYSIAEQLANFESITQEASAAQVPIWISTTQPRHFSADKILTQFVVRDSILRRYGDMAIDFWSGTAQPNGLIESQYNSGDGIHLNNAGHRLLFEQVRAKHIPALLGLVRIVWWRRIWAWVRFR